MDFLERLKDEKTQLEDKTSNLSSFFGSTEFKKLSTANQLLLMEQVELMQRYLNVLIIRIELIEK